MTAPPLTRQEFQKITGVSDAVMARLGAYAALLEKWQKKINLVGGGTVADLWRRHMLDSAQLAPLLPDGGVIVDMGSGAGFPGLVLAAMTDNEVHLIESDTRKCAFLAEAARIMEVTPRVTLHNDRIEAVPPFAADVVTARALKSLDELLGYAQPFLKPSTTCLFPKGKTVDDELTLAANNWKMTATGIPSLSDPSGTILKLEAVSSRDD
ncbi:MAG: 16S rRNA (guanine(527)-N(7))-methyltransferase RsmG [Alphaproteobacteria bacterium]